MDLRLVILKVHTDEALSMNIARYGFPNGNSNLQGLRSFQLYLAN